MNTPPAIVGRPAPDPLIRLFDGSSLVGLTDGELLARFVATRDEAAFEGLVARLGPMVLGVARRMLRDRADADDAFQATFLVLVRRARSVGRGELIGPWLHGVAVRVCRQARARASRRAAREQTGVSVDLLPPGSRFAVSPDLLAGAELQATIDAEIARLPVNSRRLIVLCDVEGLTRDEAADRLGWTPNMVRGRLARARTRLRANLARRGCLPPGLAAPTTEASVLIALSGWFAPPAPLVAATARAALALLTPSGRSTVLATGLATTSTLHLAEGVIRTMFLTSGKFVAAGVITAGALAAGAAGVILAQDPAPTSADQPIAQKAEAAAKPVPEGPPADTALKSLLEERLRSAQKRQAAQQAFYEEGRITIDRLIDADRQLMQAEHALGETPESRRTSIQTYVDRIKRIYDKEVREVTISRATTADIASAADALNVARILLARESGSAPDKPNPSGSGKPASVPPSSGERPGTVAKLDPTSPVMDPGKVAADSQLHAEAAPADQSLYLVRPDLAFYLANKEAFPSLTDTFLFLYGAEAQLRDELQSPMPAAREAAVPAHLARLQELHRELHDQGRDDPLVAKKLELVRLASEQAANRGVDNPPGRDAADLTALRQERLQNARLRQTTQQAFYDEGRITIDRLIDANYQEMQAEQAVATSPEDRRTSLQTYVGRLKRIHDREVRDLEVGRATSSDVTEAADRLLEARIMLAQQIEGPRGAAGGISAPASKPKPGQGASAIESEKIAAFNGMRVVVARKLFAEAERLFPTELTPSDYLAELHTLLEAELAAATSQEERDQIFQKMAEAAQRALKVTEDLVGRGEKKPSDKLRVYLDLLALQARAAGEKATEPQATTDLDRRMTEVERKVDRILDLLDSQSNRPKVKR